VWETNVAHLRVRSSNNFHHYLRSSVLLKFLRLMTPKLSNSLCLRTLFQFTTQKPFPSFCISLSTYLGSRKKDIKYIGTADMTMLIIVILLPSDRSLPFYPANLLCIHSMSDLHCTLASQSKEVIQGRCMAVTEPDN